MAKKILLADDSITIQKVVELTFSDGDFEVTAVNNGAKAIQKLSEMRPDIILSDIIMPEKNGYEVCEFVKSHPDFRSIPVVLLTGTFEPFDPDRADKAGCDAVVTKPFESQSLIHKVEELIEQSHAAAPAPPPAPAAAPPAPAAPEQSPWAEEQPAPAAEPSSFSPAPGFTPAPQPPAAPAFTHDADVFNAAQEPAAEQSMPLEAPAESPFGGQEFAGETKAFPRMTFDQLSNMAASQPSAPAMSAPEPSPWDEQPSQQFAQGAFEEAPAPVEAPAPQAGPAEEENESPFGAPPPAEEFSGETRAFPRLTLDQVAAVTSEEAAPPAVSEPAAPASPWDEQPSFSGETKAFPRMSFEDLQAAASQAGSTPAPSPWGEPAAPPAPAWQEPDEPAAAEAPEAPAFEEPASKQFAPVADEAPAAEPEPAWAAAAAQPAPPTQSAAPAGSVELTDEQVDRIARRVVQLMSDQVVRNIAWEVIPDLAEIVVKERIRQLETEA